MFWRGSLKLLLPVVATGNGRWWWPQIYSKLLYCSSSSYPMKYQCDSSLSMSTKWFTQIWREVKFPYHDIYYLKNFKTKHVWSINPPSLSRSLSHSANKIFNCLVPVPVPVYQFQAGQFILPQLLFAIVSLQLTDLTITASKQTLFWPL